MKSLRTAIFVTVLLVFCFSSPLAKTWYIKPDGTGDAPTIQAGIDSAMVNDIVLLANGTYTGLDNKDLDYNGKAITVRSESGNPQLCVIDCEQLGRGFHFHSGEGSGSILEGVMITNGYLDIEQSGFGGAGISCDASSPTITHCIFLNNSAAHAGAMEIINSSSPVVTHCTFTGNGSNWGGGGVLANDFPTFTHCIFSNNWSSFGGAVCGSANFDNCTFSSNTAQWEGGGISGSATLTNCLFSGNSAGDYGGAYYGSGTMANCAFAGNSAQGGGAVYCTSSSTTITNCTFYNNSSTGLGGGGVYCIGASPTIEKTIFAFGGGGEAVFCDGSSFPTLSCCDIYGNAGGDWVGYIAGQFGNNHNISADPEFCGAEVGNFYLQSDSPCAWNRVRLEWCPPQIGAFPIGCGTVASEEKTWGAIKSLYGE